ncbi:MAG: hypothetical protein V4622_11905 [Bacteroidota bacterium]
MKKIFLILTLLVSFAFTTKAQEYVVYDGEVFSIMFKSNSANTKILDVQFSSQDETTGEWQWNIFEVTDYFDFEDTEVGGFTFNVKDGVGSSFAVDYYRDQNYVLVHAIRADGSYGTEWRCDLRKE